MAKSYFYWNLHRGAWSEMVRGKVVGRHASVVLADAEFRVRPAGRERVLREGRKNVHAFAITSRADCWPEGREGALMGEELNPAYGWVELTYNPYRAATFVRKDDGQPVTFAGTAVLTADKRVFAREVK